MFSLTKSYKISSVFTWLLSIKHKNIMWEHATFSGVIPIISDWSFKFFQAN